MKKQYLPIEISPIDVAFGGKALEILPPFNEIPEEFSDRNNKWVLWGALWFYHGLKRLPVPKKGIDLMMAMANLSSVQGSYAPKHEHKIAGIAYLASLWFESPDGEEVKKD